MATIMDSVQYTLEQRIVPTIYEAGWALDPVYPVIKRSSMNVERRGIGRGWTVLKTWQSGVAGTANFESAQGTNVLSGLNHSVIYDGMDSFQSVGESPHVKTFQSTVTLVKHKGNFYLPTVMMQADRLSASIGSMVAANMKALGTLLAQQEASVFYSTSASTGQLVSLGNVATAVANKSGDTSTIVLDLGDATASENGTYPTGRIHNLRAGMMVDLYDDTGTTKRNDGFNVIVGNVDPLANTVEFTRVDGGTFQDTTTLGGGITYNDATGADDDIVVIKDSVNVTPGGLETWIADGSTVTDFYGIDVTDYGQFKSYAPSASSAALTETLLNKWFGRFYEAFPGRRLDMAITTMGVLLGFIDNLDSWVQGGTEGQSDNKPAYPGRMYYERNARSLMVEAGWEAFRYRFASRPIEFYTSTQCNSGTLYAGRLRNGGLTRYVPPTLPGAKTDNRLGSEVTWVAPLVSAGGPGSIFKHAHNTAGATTSFLEAPFFRHWVVVPDSPNWLKGTDIAEISW